MQIKRFEAKDMTTALGMIKQEFGPEAVILSVRTATKSGVLGQFRKNGVEVTAAIDPAVVRSEFPGPVATGSERIDTVSIGERPKATPPNGRMIRFARNHRPERSNGEPIMKMENDRVSPPSKTIAELHDRLTFQGIAPEWLTLLDGPDFRRGGFGSPERQLREAAARFLDVAGVKVNDMAEDPKRPLRLAFVGPTGVGKTTTVAKLSARYALDLNRSVAVITMDTRRVGAVEQMKQYAGIIGVPVALATDASTMIDALARFRDVDVVLIDTPGIGPKQKDAIQGLADRFRPQPDVRVHLVLSATAKDEDLVHTLDRYRRVKPDALVFTKLDESLAFGGLINQALRAKLPVAYLCVGQQIPEDIRPATHRLVADALLAESGAPATAAPRKERPSDSAVDAPVPAAPARSESPREASRPGAFMANMNSDIFHRPDCKWTKMIKPENRITFVSVDDAVARGFNPCRYCRPRPAAERRIHRHGVTGAYQRAAGL